MTETTANRPSEWTWTNSMRRPCSVHVEPSFKPELGLVFVGIGERDPETGTWKADSPEGQSHHGIWLDRERLAALRQALDAAEAASDGYGDDGQDPDPASPTVTLRAVEYGTSTLEVDRGEYERAKAADRLYHMLDHWLSDMETDTVVYEPDGTRV